MKLHEYNPLESKELREFIRGVCHRADVDRVGLFRCDPENRVIQGVIGIDEHGCLERITSTLYHCSPSDGSCLQDVAQGVVPFRVVAPVGEAEAEKLHPGMQFGVGYAAVPVEHEGQIIGVLAVDNLLRRQSIKAESVPVLFREAASIADTLHRLEVTRPRDMMSHVVNLLSDGICLISTTGWLMEGNRALERLYGLEPGQAREFHKHTLFYPLLPDGENDPLWDEIGIASGDWEGETYNRRRDGSLFPVRLRFIDLYHTAGIQAQLGVVHDLSSARALVDLEHKRLQEEADHQREIARTQALVLQELERRVEARTAALVASNRDLEATSYSIAHDLRGPLRGINGFARVLLEDYRDSLDAQGQEYLRRIAGGAEHLGHVMDGLLSLARMTRVEMRYEEIDLSGLAAEVADRIGRESRDRQVEVVIQPGLVACADHDLLTVVLENLLRNAWKFTTLRSVARIELFAEQQNGERVFCIRDNGVGFDMRYADKLFGIFQRLHGPQEFEGTGIGLATVQRILHRHGGDIRAESQPGKGAAFYFTLPDA